MRSKRAWRKIHLLDKVWIYRVGRGYLVIRGPKGERFTPHASSVKGSTPDIYERGQWKRTSDGVVTPAEVKRYIEVGLSLRGVA